MTVNLGIAPKKEEQKTIEEKPKELIGDDEYINQLEEEFHNGMLDEDDLDG